MKKIIHRYNWNDYNFMAARKIFEQGFGTAVHPLEDGSSITVLPDQRVFEDLRGQERATLECLENRSSSSVFRIKELATVYHVFDDNRACRVFEDFDHYQESPTLDQLLLPFQLTLKKMGHFWLKGTRHLVLSDITRQKQLIQLPGPRFW